MVDKTDNLPPPLVTPDQLKIDFAHLEAELAALEASEIPPVLEDDDDLAAVAKVANDLIKLRKKIEIIRAEQSRPLIDAQRVVNGYFTGTLTNRAAIKQGRAETVASHYLQKKAQRERIAREKAAETARKEAEAANARLAQAAAQASASGTGPIMQAAEQADALTGFANKAATAAAAPIADLSRSITSGGSAGLASNWTFEIESIDQLDVVALRPFFTVAAIEAAMRAFVKSGRREITGARIYEDAKARFRA